MRLRAIAFAITAIALGAGIYLLYEFVLKGKPPTNLTVDIGKTGERKAIPVPDVKFADVTTTAGIRFTHFSGATTSKLLPETMGSGVVVLDFDNDHRPDLLFVNSMAWPGQPKPEQPPTLVLYRNKGDGTFEDVTVAAGLDISLFGIGACVGDFNNDGYDDLFITCVGGHRLFQNQGGKKFVDVTAKAGVAGPGVVPKSATAEEFFRHALPIPFGTSVTFIDYDGDGKLDLFVCHYCTWSPAIDLSIKSTLTGVGRTYQQPKDLEGNQCSLYRNRGDGTFEDVSESAGVRVFEAEGTDAGAKQRPVGKSLGVILYDADSDGWPDLFVANDSVRNFFFHNISDGQGGRKFEERGKESNVAYAQGIPRGAMGIDIGEYSPGKNALLIANFANEENTFLVQLDPKRPLSFSDACAAVGMQGESKGPLKFGTFFFDYDLDGREDLLVCNGHIEPEIARVQASQKHAQPALLFWNTGNPDCRYEPVTANRAGADLFKPLVGRGAVYADFDGDGDVDVVLVANDGLARVLRNDAPKKNHWLRLNLVGDGVKSNRSAIGAEVEVQAGGQTFRRSITGARGYLSQPEMTVTVGLGNVEKVDKITIRWPGQSGGSETWTNLAIDRVHELKQGASK